MYIILSWIRISIMRTMRFEEIMTDTRWDKVISNILDYLIEKENDGDDEAWVLYLLYEVRELLKKEKRQDVRDVREKEESTRFVEVILQNIKDRLTKIEKQNLS